MIKPWCVMVQNCTTWPRPSLRCFWCRNVAPQNQGRPHAVRRLTTTVRTVLSDIIYIYIVARCRTAWRVKPARERERVTERERAVRWWNRMAKIWWKMMHPIVWVLFLGQVPPASDSSVHKAVTGLSPGRRESLAPRTGFC